MKMTHAAIFFALTLSASCNVLAQTQVVPVTSTWQISTNNGATWSSGQTVVPQSTSSVRVRMEVSWTPPVPDPQTFLGAALFDGYVRGTNGAGPADTVTNIFMLDNGFFAPARAAIQGRRVASDLLKIDPGDNAALGLGLLNSANNAPVTGGIVFGSQVVVFDYRLQLDGTLGSREIGLVYGAVSQPVSIVTTTVPSSSYTVQPLTQAATLVVVPAPASTVMVGTCAAMLLRRRRGR